ncbi:MAG: hypothetical protein JNK14_03565 [Chitinophagaceae bacterium]|nr:hypothetical protein [Chitinophagaceae bacterium]
MKTWIKAGITGSVIAAVFYFVYSHFFNQMAGYTVKYTVKAERQKNVRAEDMAGKIMPVLERRMSELKSEVSIRVPDKNLLEITITPVTDTALARKTIIENSTLEIREIYTLKEIASAISKIAEIANRLLKNRPVVPLAPNNNFSEEENLFSSLIAFSVSSNGTIDDNMAHIGTCRASDTAILNRLMRDPAVRENLPADLEFMYGMAEPSSSGKSPHTFLYLYAIRTYNTEPVLRDNDIETATAEKGYNGEPEIRFRFNRVAAKEWELLTRKNTGRFLAIIVNSKLVSVPRVNEPIMGGHVSLSGGFTMAEAEQLAQQLRSGHLPFTLAIIGEEIQPVPGSSNRFTCFFRPLHSCW